MKTLTQTIIAIAALSTFTANFTLAQNKFSQEAGDSTEIRARETEIAAQAAQKQAQAAQKQKKAAQKQAEAAQKRAEIAAVLAKAQSSTPAAPVLPSASSPAQISPTWFSFGSRSGSTGTVLVIPSEQTGTKELIAINEDMNVMSRIFEKNLEQDRFVHRHEVFLPLLGLNSSYIQSMYLQGYGALFMLKVDFPLSPSPDQQQEQQETETEEEGDPVWRQIRREMYEPENIRRKRKADRAEEKYDPEKVEDLKTTLIKSLKHATNIRALEPDESVILTVVGSGGYGGRMITAVNVTRNNQIIVEQKDANGKRTMRIVKGDSLDNIGLSSPSVLVIRAKKSEIDQFSKDALDFEKFRQCVQLLTYPLLGRADGDGDALDLYLRSKSTGSSNIRR